MPLALPIHPLPLEQTSDNAWWVYVLISHQQLRTYVGIARNVETRLAQHNGHRPGGAKSTRAARPWEIGTVYGPYCSRSAASKIEYRLKQQRGVKRLAWKPR